MFYRTQNGIEYIYEQDSDRKSIEFTVLRDAIGIPIMISTTQDHDHINAAIQELNKAIQ